MYFILYIHIFWGELSLLTLLSVESPVHCTRASAQAAVVDDSGVSVLMLDK